MLEALWARIISGHAPITEPRHHERHPGAAPVGMVQLGSMTYCILRLTPTLYGVVRVLDDRYLGCFTTQPTLETDPEEGVDRSALEAVARAAIRVGRTSWVPESGRKVL